MALLLNSVSCDARGLSRYCSFADKVVSALKAWRPELDALKADGRQRRFTFVSVTAFDRVARSPDRSFPSRVGHFRNRKFVIRREGVATGDASGSYEHARNVTSNNIGDDIDCGPDFSVCLQRETTVCLLLAAALVTAAATSLTALSDSSGYSGSDRTCFAAASARGNDPVP